MASPVLFVHEDFAGTASLQLPLGGDRGHEIVELAPRLTRLLFVLADAAARSSGGVPTVERGFLSRAEIARRMARLPGTGSPVSAEVVTEYASKVRRAIDNAVARLPEELLLLIENKRGFGYRIGPCGLVVKLLDAGSLMVLCETQLDPATQRDPDN
jgi:hypothetical protein